jgi:hypothetical protein
MPIRTSITNVCRDHGIVATYYIVLYVASSPQVTIQTPYELRLVKTFVSGLQRLGSSLIPHFSP